MRKFILILNRNSNQLNQCKHKLVRNQTSVALQGMLQGMATRRKDKATCMKLKKNWLNWVGFKLTTLGNALTIYVLRHSGRMVLNTYKSRQSNQSTSTDNQVSSNIVLRIRLG